MIVGITVQAISSFVLPCTGLPSDSSPGLARNVMTVAQHHEDDREHEGREHDHDVKERVDVGGFGLRLRAVPIGDQQDDRDHDGEHCSGEARAGSPRHRAAFY